MARLGAALWLQGHTHLPADDVVGPTRVVCNPVGDPNERVPPADHAFVVEALPPGAAA